jgi:hypothetical protein
MLIVLYVLIALSFVLDSNAHGAEPWTAEWERTIKAAEHEGEISYYSLGGAGAQDDRWALISIGSAEKKDVSLRSKMTGHVIR